MILKKLIIHNMFAYQGKIELDLEPKKDKNIILIGARNGRGKTSLLRIIRILIHGLKENVEFTLQDEKLRPNDYALGNKRWKGIFHNSFKVDTSSVKGILEFEGKELLIERKFEKNRSSFDENLIVTFNSKKELDPQYFLNNIIPKDFAQFFFFDGEKLESIMNTNDLKIKESLEVLLNIKTYEKLIEKIKESKSKYKKQVQFTKGEKEIERLKIQLTGLKKDTEINEDNIQQINKEINEIENTVNNISEQTINLIVDKKVDIKPLQDRKEQIEKELVDLKSNISDKVKSTELFILMLENLSKNYLHKLEDDTVNYQLDEQLKLFKRTLNSIVSKIQNNIFDSDIEEIPTEYNLDFDTTEFYQQRIKDESDKAWIDFKQSKQKSIDKQIIYYNEENRVFLKNVFESRIAIYDRIIKMKSLGKELKIIDEKLENETEYASKNDSIIEKRQKEKARLEEEKSLKIEKRTEVKLVNDKKLRENKSLELEIRLLETKLTLSKPVLNAQNLSDELISFFEEFKHQLLNKKVESLENEFNRYIVEFAHDEEWIKYVKIDKNFEIKIVDFLEREMPLNSLSAGQRQILATALIQALGSVSQVKSFICIDTPLARLDKENRKTIISNYYPNASKQVIILSSNTEIDPLKEEYAEMKKFIAKEYTIVSNEYKSFFENGYFQESNRK
ncbi:MAG TPA: hypothetical protein EYG73_08070 [Arcobacter sp.]|nr:hypothetical protein [Arcobacter sp.]